MPISANKSHIDRTNRETKAHGTYAFPAACYIVNFPKDKAVAHWHQELELFYVADGNVTLYAASQQFKLEPGMGAFINSNILHTLELFKTCSSATLHYVVFHPRLIGGDEQSIFWTKYINPIIYNLAFPVTILSNEIKWQREVLTKLDICWNNIAKDLPGYEIISRNNLSDIILELYDNKPKETVNQSKKIIKYQSKMKDMLDYIHTNYFELITVEKLAYIGNMSISSCIRCFKEVVGTTPLQYIKNYRLQTAATRLKDTDWLISEIGFRCGFEEMGYFASQFKLMYGVTPSEYRKTISIK